MRAPHPGRRLARVLAGSALAAELASVVLVAATLALGEAVSIDTYTLGALVLGTAYPVVGWIIASRRPRNSIGWIFLAIGLSQALDSFNHQYSTFGLVTRPGSLPLAAEASWAGTFTFFVGFILLVSLSVLLFPDGRPPSRRWRPVTWLVGLAIVVFIVPTAFVTWPYRGVALTTTTPAGPSGPAADAAGVFQVVGLLLALAAAILSIAGLLNRFRRSSGIERQQLKWFTLAGAIEVLSLASAPFLVQVDTAFAPVVTVGSALVGPLLPIAAGIAILRYRLFDIDRVVSRTVSYAALTATLAAVYAVGFLGIQALLPFTANGGSVAVAASTLAVFVLFQPVRRRIQDLVDRRFNRRRYDAQLEVDAFPAHVRDLIDAERVAAALTTTLDRTMQPASISIWLRSRGRPPDRA